MFILLLVPSERRVVIKINVPRQMTQHSVECINKKQVLKILKNVEKLPKYSVKPFVKNL